MKKLKILSSAALAGMLAAAGCGAGAGSGGANAPVGTIPGSGSGPSSHVRGGTTKVSLLVPIPHADSSSTASSSTAGSSRKPQFVSPGTWGIQVLLGDGQSYVSTTPAPAAGLFSGGPDAGGNQFVVFSNPTGAIVTPGTQQPPSALPATLVTANGGNSGGNGPANLAPTVYGNPGGTTPATVSYSYALSGTPGYYLFTLTFVGLAPNFNEKVSVALTDNPAHNYFVLSEGTSAYFNTPAAGAVAQQISLTLNPVLAQAFIVGPSAPVPVLSLGPLTGNGSAAIGVTGYAYQFSVFAADHRGYPIPSQPGVSFDSGARLSLAQTTTGGVVSTSPTSGTLSYSYGLATLADTTFEPNPAIALDPVPFNSGHAFDAVGGYTIATTATLVGETTSITTAAAATPLVVGDSFALASETPGIPHIVTAVSPSTSIVGTEDISFTPAFGSGVALNDPVTLSPAPATSAYVIHPAFNTWSAPGSLFGSVAFNQLTGIPSLIPPTTAVPTPVGYTEGLTVTVLASNLPAGATTPPPNGSTPFAVAPVGVFVTTGTIPGYTYTANNYPTLNTSSNPTIIGTPITVTPPTGVGVTIQSHSIR